MLVLKNARLLPFLTENFDEELADIVLEIGRASCRERV